MKKLLCITAIVLAGCDGTHIPTYDELRKYPVSCQKETAQLAELTRIQDIKGFAQNPDDLNEEDRAYNSKLKATIWWYSLECHEKNIVPVDYAE